METVVEQQRRLYEERERLADAMKVLQLMSRQTQRDQINNDYMIKFFLDRSVTVCKTILELNKDKDGLRKEEMDAITGPNEFGEFYKNLKEVKEFHRKHPDEIFIPMSVEFDKFYKEIESNPDEPLYLVDFSDEEGYGKYLDLHKLHSQYVNLKGIEKVTYVHYLEIFNRLYEFPRKFKNKQYKDYVENLLNYLVGYLERVLPLYDMDEEFFQIEKDFKAKWSVGEFIGWGKEAGSALAHSGAHLDLTPFTSAAELASLGLDRLKSALMALNLKCGGTLQQRATRLFSTKGKSLDQLDSSLFAKNKNSKKTSTDEQYNIAMMEAKIYRLTDIVDKQKLDTKDNVQRRQARIESEKDDDVEDPVSESEDEDEDNEIIYNPKNLPLGWDGKPIPYWLYKLHGLNINYKCEICGNQTYRGPKAFQRHFSEWRHAHGMRCLGIPNTAHFANVTKIEDALALWAKIRQAKNAERWNPEIEEEFEDSAGNVVTRRTYDDLIRQGVL